MNMLQPILRRAPHTSLMLLDARMGVRKSIGYQRREECGENISNARWMESSVFQKIETELIDDAIPHLPDVHELLAPGRWTQPPASTQAIDRIPGLVDPKKRACKSLLWAVHYNPRWARSAGQNDSIKNGGLS